MGCRINVAGSQAMGELAEPVAGDERDRWLAGGGDAANDGGGNGNPQDS